MKTKMLLVTIICTMLLVPSLSFGQHEGGGNRQGRGEMDRSQIIEKLVEQGIDVPEDWEEMTNEEFREWLSENLGKNPGMKGEKREADRSKIIEKLAEQGIEAPENWEEMTNEEFHEWLKELGIGGSPKIKAKNYKKFQGQLQEKKRFRDQEEIENGEAVEYLQRRGIINGYADGSFQPQNSISRAEAIKIILEALGEDVEENAETGFEDVPQGEWFSGYVKRAKEKGVVNGYADGSFKPHQTVNKVELLKILFKSFDIDVSEYEVSDLYTDTSLDAWYAPYLQYAKDAELIDSEDDGLFHPEKGMTREEFSEVVYRLMEQQESL